MRGGRGGKWRGKRKECKEKRKGKLISQEIINFKIISKNKPMSSFRSVSISVKLANFNIPRNNLHLI